MPRVSVIIINYNGEEFIISCLKSLEGQIFKDFEIIVVDNGSTDNSLFEIKKFLEKSAIASHLKLIPADRNLGFAGGNLEGLKHSKSEYIALLNNDTEADKKWLENLVKVMAEYPDVGICASKLLVFETDVLDSAGDGYATSLKGFKRGEGQDSKKYNKQEYVFGACAGAALYRRRMIEEIGFFDEDFFLIHEDTDLNFRAQLSGWKVMYVPTAIIYHKIRSTIGHMSEIAVYYTLRNSEFVRIKNVPFALFFRCLPEFILGTISEFIYFAFKYRKLRLYLKAKMDVIKNLRVILGRRRKIMKMKKVDNKYLHNIMTSVWDREFFSTKIKKFFHG